MTVVTQLMKVQDHEIATLLKVGKQEGIVGLLDMMEDEDKLVLVFELCDQQLQQWTGSEFVPKVPETEGKKWAKDIALALKTLHSMNIVHRDLKPQNILLKQGKAMICDFGVSSSSVTKFHQTEGTIHFMAPEVCDPSLSEYEGKPVDVWAFGVTLYCMVFGQLPWTG